MKIRFLNQRFTLPEIWKLRSSIRKILCSPEKIGNVILVSVSKLLKKPKVLGAPVALMVEVSSRCDMACPMCPVVLNKTRRQTGIMPFDTFRKIVDEVGDRVSVLALWNYGEPLLNPDIGAMIAYAHKKSIVTVINTNGLSLNEDKIRQLLDSGLDYLVVSFDGATEETYEKFRGKGNFSKVSAHIKLLTRIKKERAQTLPFIELQYIVMKGNVHEIEDIRILAGTLGVDKLSLKKFTYVGGNEALPFLVPQEKYRSAKHKGTGYSGGCSRVAGSAVILWNADVAACCGDLDFKYIFGNINTGEKFMDIWNNQNYVAFRRKALRDIDSIGMCSRCSGKNFDPDMFIE